MLLLQGRGIHPKVLLSKSNLLFGECAQHQSRDIQVTIQNAEPVLPIDFNFQHNGYFHMTPEKGQLEPQSQQTLIFSYLPKNLGKFTQQLNLFLNNSNYQMPLKFMGTTSTIQQVENLNQTKRGVECLPGDFTQERNYIEGEQYQVYQRKKKKVKDSGDNSTNNLYEDTISTIHRPHDQDVTVSFDHSQNPT